MPKAIQGQHPSPLQNLPRTLNGGIHFSMAIVEMVAEASHQNLILLRPPRGKTLPHVHQIGEANATGAIACSLIRGGDIQILLPWAIHLEERPTVSQSIS